MKNILKNKEMRIKKNNQVIKLTESDIKKIVKKVLTEQNYDYEFIENIDDADKLYHLIKDAIGMFMDDEAVVEAAFMAFDKNPDLYHEANEIFLNDEYWKKVFNNRKTSLLGIVKRNININQIYHKKSIARISHENNFK